MLSIWKYAQKLIETIPRLRGEKYRHIIDWLIRKPGAFENYRYREDLFPTSRFRIAYDSLKSQNPLHCTQEYLKILYLAARETESGVDEALRYLLDREEALSADAVENFIKSDQAIPPVTEVRIEAVHLATYDELLKEVGYAN